MTFWLLSCQAGDPVGEHTTMMSAARRLRRRRCSPNRRSTRPAGWVHRTDLNGAERPPTGSAYQTLTCRNDISAGQPHRPDKVDTEVVAQRRPTALNSVEPQVNGVVEVTALPSPLP